MRNFVILSTALTLGLLTMAPESVSTAEAARPVVVVAVASSPKADAFVWEDGATLSQRDDWTEFTLNCEARGAKLWLEIVHGRVQVDWAEVVFDDGQAQVVDFSEKTHGPGLYSLLDFANDRKVDHVHMVARAKTDEARVVLRMQT